MARFAIVGERNRLIVLETKKRNHPNSAPYILRKGTSPYEAGFRYCLRCNLFILTRRIRCPEHPDTLLRVKRH